MASITTHPLERPYFSEWYTSFQESAIREPEKAVTDLMTLSEKVSDVVRTQLHFLHGFAGDIANNWTSEYCDPYKPVLTPYGAERVTTDLLKEKGLSILTSKTYHSAQLGQAFRTFADSSEKTLAVFMKHFRSIHLTAIVVEKIDDKLAVLIMDSAGTKGSYLDDAIGGIARELIKVTSLENVKIFAFDDCRQSDNFSCSAFAVTDTVEAVSRNYLRSLVSADDLSPATGSSPVLKVETHTTYSLITDPETGDFTTKDEPFFVTHISRLPFPFSQLTQSVSTLESDPGTSMEDFALFKRGFFRESWIEEIEQKNNTPKKIRNMFANDKLREYLSRAIVLRIQEGKAYPEDELHGYFRFSLPEVLRPSAEETVDKSAA